MITLINDDVIVDLNRLAGAFIIGALLTIPYRPVGIIVLGIVLAAIVIRIIIEVTRWFHPSFLMKQGKNK